MRGRRWGPRLGLGRDRIDAERARFSAPQDVLQYFCDRHTWTHENLAARCGVSRPPLTRWMNGSREPTLSKLAEVIAPLGWKPVIVLERTGAALNELMADPAPLDDLLEFEIRAVLRLVSDCVTQGLDVVVGGEAAAVLQGVPIPTRHLTLHVRPEHAEAFLRSAAKRWLEVTRLPDGWTLRHGPVTVEVSAAPVRPPTRMVEGPGLGALPVVDLGELLAGSHGVGPSVYRAAGKLIDCAG
ncbi:MAG TPA: helix-turn-helix transcriptional regulator [Pseudonocardia sp.]|nr:helix-turn-helix transcriptional regulator [Pseudonocardia sp.]